VVWNLGDAEIYTLTVATDHTLFVGVDQVLVHNAYIPCMVIYSTNWLDKIKGHIQHIRIENRGVMLGKVKDPATQAAAKKIIEDISANPDEARETPWNKPYDRVIMSRKGNQLVVHQLNGQFVSYLRISAGDSADFFTNPRSAVLYP
jgi:hypothetical protein